MESNICCELRCSLHTKMHSNSPKVLYGFCFLLFYLWMYFVVVVAFMLLAYATTATTRTQLTSIVLQISARRFVYLFHSIVSIPFPLVLIHIHSFNRQTLAKMCIEIWCSRCLNVDLRSVPGLFFLLLFFFLFVFGLFYRLLSTQFYPFFHCAYFDFCFYFNSFTSCECNRSLSLWLKFTPNFMLQVEKPSTYPHCAHNKIEALRLFFICSFIRYNFPRSRSFARYFL